MSTQNNSLSESDQLYQDLLAAKKIKMPNYGIITDGLCSTPEAQAEFDDQQKGKAPIIDG
jgi:hypothetical protein